MPVLSKADPREASLQEATDVAESRRASSTSNGGRGRERGRMLQMCIWARRMHQKGFLEEAASEMRPEK